MTNTEFQLFAGMIANKVGVTCIQGPSNGKWSADIQRNVINYPYKRYYTDGDLGLLIHESAHLRFTTKWEPEDFERACKSFGSVPKNASQVSYLLNALEDIRIEARIQEIYPGAWYYLNEMNEETWNHQYVYQPEPRLWMGFSMYAAWEAVNPDWAEEWLELRGLEGSKKLRDALTKAMPHVKTYTPLKTTEELIGLMSKEVLPHYLPLCDDAPTEQEMKEAIKQLMEFLMAVSKAVKQSKGTDPNAKPSKGSGGGDAPDPNGKDAKMSMGMGIKAGKPKKGGKGGFGVGQGSLGAVPDHFFRERKGVSMTEGQLREQVKQNFASARKAISIIKDIETRRWEGNYQSGKLQNRKLYKLKSNNFKIFTKQVADAPDDRDLVFSILVDESGSMGGDKIAHATIATALIGEALKRAGKEFAVYGFHDRVTVHKKFDDGFKIGDMLVIERSIGGGTGDGEAVAEARKDLLKRPEKKKIMIVVCDGGSGSTDEFELKHQLELCKGIEVYGIGIQDDSVKRYYKNHIVIQQPSQLGPELLKIFKKNVGKRNR